MGTPFDYLHVGAFDACEVYLTSEASDIFFEHMEADRELKDMRIQELDPSLFLETAIHHPDFMLQKRQDIMIVGYQGTSLEDEIGEEMASLAGAPHVRRRVSVAPDTGILQPFFRGDPLFLAIGKTYRHDSAKKYSYTITDTPENIPENLKPFKKPSQLREAQERLNIKFRKARDMPYFEIENRDDSYLVCTFYPPRAANREGKRLEDVLDKWLIPISS